MQGKLFGSGGLQRTDEQVAFVITAYMSSCMHVSSVATQRLFEPLLTVDVGLLSSEIVKNASHD